MFFSLVVPASFPAYRRGNQKASTSIPFQQSCVSFPCMTKESKVHIVYRHPYNNNTAGFFPYLSASCVISYNLLLSLRFQARNFFINTLISVSHSPVLYGTVHHLGIVFLMYKIWNSFVLCMYIWYVIYSAVILAIFYMSQWSLLKLYLLKIRFTPD